MILQTKRLILRVWQESDAEELYRYAGDPAVGLPAGWMPHTSVAYSRDIIRTVLSAPETYAVCLKKDEKPIGCVGLHRNDLAVRADEYELGYWLGKPFWGQGIIPEASRELVRYAFLELGMARIWCGHYEGNEKSRRVMIKLGFVHHHTTEGLKIGELGETRVGYAYLLTKERFQKVELFRKQRALLDTFLANGAISRSQYNKSFGDLCDLMMMHGVDQRDKKQRRYKNGTFNG